MSGFARAAAMACALSGLALAVSVPAWAQGEDDLSTLLAPAHPAPAAPLIMPAPPRASDLVPVPLPGHSGMRFFVDEASIRRAEVSHLRYTLVARSPAGVDNVSYEEIDCLNENWRINALWNDSARRWDRVSAPSWIGVDVGGGGNLHAVLDTQYFCRDGGVDGTVPDVIRRLRLGLRGGGEGVLP